MYRGWELGALPWDGVGEGRAAARQHASGSTAFLIIYFKAKLLHIHTHTHL